MLLPYVVMTSRGSVRLLDVPFRLCGRLRGEGQGPDGVRNVTVRSPEPMPG